MEHAFSRTEMLIGKEGLEKLRCARVAVFGVGGVGSYAVEGLCRAGVGSLLLVDHDTVSLTNLNRQLHATMETIGQYKTKLMAARVRSINPEALVETREAFCLPERVSSLLAGEFDYVIDAVDTVAAKLCLAEEALRRDIPILSCMGAGNKLDPTRFRVGDIYETSGCPLCRVMRRELRARGVEALRVVYSTEPPASPQTEPADGSGRHPPGSISFVPPVAGLIAAGEAVRHLLLR